MKVRDLVDFSKYKSFYFYKNTHNEDNKLENLILGLSEGNSNLNKFLDKEVKDFKENIIILWTLTQLK